MPVTSIRTPRADVDAPFAPSMNIFSRRETCIAAVVIPIIDAETDRGSMIHEARECSGYKTLNDDRGRGGVRRREIGKDPFVALWPPTLRPWWNDYHF